MHERREASRQVAALCVWTARYVALQRHCERAVGEVVDMCAAAAPEDSGAAAARVGRQLRQEPRLSDAGLAVHDDHAPSSFGGSRELLAELTENGIAADKRRAVLGGRRVTGLDASCFGLASRKPPWDPACLNLPVELNRGPLGRDVEFALQRVLADLELAHGLVARSQ